MSASNSLHSLVAQVVYTGIGTPLADGAVIVERSPERSTVVDVLPAQEARRIWPDAVEVDTGFAISPAPVNAHTHLDLSDMPLVSDVYERFIPTVIAFAQSGRRTLQAARRGVRELLESGVHQVGDIVTREDVLSYLLSHEQLSGVAYWEVIGMDPARTEAQLAETRELIERFLPLQRSGGVRLGLTPHTPHTVNDRLLTGLVSLAREFSLPLQIHVEESPLEKPMFVSGEGELADVRRSFDPDWQPPGVPPLLHLERLGVLQARPTLVHMVNVTEEEIRRVQHHGCRVVHCPRSNDQLQCGRFPWETYARHGVDLAIGTDSRGSSPSLSVHEEVRHALQLHGSRASELALVRAAVKGGNQVLGSRPPYFMRGADARHLHIWDRERTVAAAA